MPMLKQPASKYRPFPRVQLQERAWIDQVIARPPAWCSVDLRDGNQALIEPMNRERKLRLFDALLKVGFKEIEVGFPAASQTDFDFIRYIVGEGLIPDDVTIQVLTQAREPLIRRTFEAVAGAPRVVMHVYNATAPVMRRVVFNLSKEQVIADLAVENARLIKEIAAGYRDTRCTFEYSPEHFSSTELDFAKAIVDAVTGVWEPTPDNKCIVNLPSTVETSTPNIFADMIEWMHRNLARRDSIVLSVHPHNDRGTGVAAAEFALMAGADRIEGCLFGNGERTGNVDIVTLALNMYSQGVHPMLDFSDIDALRQTVEHCNQLPVHPRHPYAGDLVYTSFSGSHQDAIKKAFGARRDDETWDVPYLPIDPKDVGRTYEAVIRVNSQSGKGGISYLLESEYGLSLPRRLQIEFSQVMQQVMDDTGREQTADDIWNVFSREYLELRGPYQYVSHHLTEDSTRPDEVEVSAEVAIDGERRRITGKGNGPIDAFVRALDADVRVMDYHEHAIGSGANATAVSYIEMRIGEGASLHGVGIDPNIVTASFKAILGGINRAAAREGAPALHAEAAG